MANVQGEVMVIARDAVEEENIMAAMALFIYFLTIRSP
jgi:hypothetical protein